MKMRKLSSTLIAGSLAFGLASTSAMAQGTPPDLTLAERGAYTLIEAGLSVMAAVVEKNGCAATARTYPAVVEVYSDGEGFSVVDDLELYTEVGQATTKGQIFNVTSGNGDVNNVSIENYTSDFGFSKKGEIMYGISDYWLNSDPWDEVIIKDFWLTRRGFIKDAGLEVITKLGFPRSKWRQVSKTIRPNGRDGYLSITKTQIAPHATAECEISVEMLWDNVGQGFFSDQAVVTVTDLTVN